MNWTNNLPSGCSSNEIERRFGDGDPDVDGNDICEEPASEPETAINVCPNCNGTKVFSGGRCKACGGDS